VSKPDPQLVGKKCSRWFQPNRVLMLLLLDVSSAMLPPCIVLQTASFLFKPGFLAAGGASSALLEPLLRILSLGWSSAAVTNYVQGVSCEGIHAPTTSIAAVHNSTVIGCCITLPN